VGGVDGLAAGAVVGESVAQGDALQSVRGDRKRGHAEGCGEQAEAALEGVRH